MRILVVSMVHNEASRYLRDAIRVWKDFADDILVYDNHSTDATPALLHDEDVWRYENDTLPLAWGRESTVRMNLFAAALDMTREGDWIFVLDADMIPAKNPRPLFESLSNDTNAVAFRLFDLWNASHFREDSFWQAHHHFRVWAVRHLELEEPIYIDDRGIHCGHIPPNYPAHHVAFAPRDFSLLHYGYAHNRDRITKHAQYLEQRWQLSEQEVAHANSIMDPDPRLVKLSFTPQYQLGRASS